MHSFYLKLAITILCLKSLACIQYQNKDQVWDMLALGLPKLVSPAIAPINMGYYILRQTHEPIFRYSDDGQFFSKVLINWSRSIDHRNFTLCPNHQLQFTKETPFSTRYLADFLQKTVHPLGKAKVYTKNHCVIVSFENPQKNFLNYYSEYEQSPSIPSQNINIEYGLGPYDAKTISPEEIVLQRKEPTKKGFNQIKLLKYKGRNDPNLTNRSIEDFNRVYIGDLPQWVQDEYASFGVMLLQSINLLINHPEKEVRKRVYNCLDTELFRKAFMPYQREFYDIANVLPVGIMGAKHSKPTQQCTLGGKKHRLTFANWKNDNVNELTGYFKSFANKYGIQVVIENISENDFIAQIMKSPHRFHLTVIALDGVRPDYRVFYEYLVNNTLIDYHIPNAQKAYEKINSKETDQEREYWIGELNHILREEAVILPLYQEVRRYYFPKHIQNIILGKDFLGYPEIAEFTL